jgi:general secretion pathway protein G
MHLCTPSRRTPFRSEARRSLARRGFSLLEVLVAVTIIAILAALVVPKVYNQVFKAKVTRAKADATAVANALKIYLTQNGMRTLPSDFEVDVLAEGSDPVLEKASLRDPWGNPWGLRVPGQDRDFDVVSYGADGQPGGDGDNEDIVHN